MTESLTWSHPMAWAVYVYVVLSLALAGGLLLLRRKVLHPERDVVLTEAAAAHQQIGQITKQLVGINRQFDRGLDQLEQVLNMVQGLFLALLQTRLVESAMLRLHKKPIWIKLLARKGLDTAFTQAEGLVRTQHINDRDEAAHEQPIP